MSLSPGTRFSSYEVVSPLGAGGMGEVFRARDTKLGREVAIKVLTAENAREPERVLRFEQEARAASALNHPNIITIHEVGQVNSSPYIVMELVEGKSLAELISAGPIPLKRTLDVAVQMAEGLAKAHAAGIVHRDMKPENVMVTRDGAVKILDFGLAKLTEDPLLRAPTGSEADLMLTRPGLIVGTYHYMSPEQATAGAIDFRSDQFAFGAVLYEMLCGKKAFSRPTPVQTMTAILEDDPVPVAQLNPRVPVPLRWILERCLDKDPDRRYASTRDLARELQSVRDHLSEMGSALTTDAVAPIRPSSRSRTLVPAACAVLGLLVGGALMLALTRERKREAPFLRTLTYSGRDHSPSASPDGRLLAFTSERDGKKQIWLKELTGGNEVALTSGPDDDVRFSPDGSSLLFAREEGAKTSLYRTAVVGGEARKVIDDALEGDWSPDGRRIAFVRFRREAAGILTTLSLASAEGEAETELTRVRDLHLIHPRFSPDGKWIAATGRSLDGASPDSIRLIPVDGKAAARTLATKDAFSISSVSWNGEGGELLYSQVSSMTANVSGTFGRIVRQDVGSGSTETLLTTPSLGMVLDVAGPGTVTFDALSTRQNLREVTVRPGAPSEGRWLTRGSSNDRQPAYSPDGKWVVFSSNRSGNLDLWEVSTATGGVRRLTFDAAEDWDPAFTPDGSRILWSSNRSGHFEIWTIGTDGSGARRVTNDGVNAENPTATPDGKWITYNSSNPQNPGVWKIRSDGSGAVRLVAGKTLRPEISPDGEYVVYQSGFTPERLTIHVVRLADGAEMPFAVTIKGPANTVGRSRWLRDGKGIAYVAPDEKGVYGVVTRDFEPGREATATPKPVAGFDQDAPVESFGISPDGSRITLATREQIFSVMVAERLERVSPPRRR